MSVVIDGKDILKDNSFLAISMSERLENMLTEKKEEIPSGILRCAKDLFSVAMDEVKENRGLSRIHKHIRQSEVSMTYRLLTDMLKISKQGVADIDFELEKLAISLEALTPDGRQIIIAKENYQTLRDIFKEMYNKSCYFSRFGEHSPYSVGTFDDSNK